MLIIVFIENNISDVMIYIDDLKIFSWYEPYELEVMDIIKKNLNLTFTCQKDGHYLTLDFNENEKYFYYDIRKQRNNKEELNLNLPNPNNSKLLFGTDIFFSTYKGYINKIRKMNDDRLDDFYNDISEVNIRSIYSGHMKNLLCVIYNKRYKKRNDLFNTPNVVNELRKISVKGTFTLDVPNNVNENPNTETMTNFVLLINSLRRLCCRVGFKKKPI